MIWNLKMQVKCRTVLMLSEFGCLDIMDELGILAEMIEPTKGVEHCCGEGN